MHRNNKQEKFNDILIKFKRLMNKSYRILLQNINIYIYIYIYIYIFFLLRI